MKKFLIILGSLIIGQTSFALDIVYPKKANVKIDSPSTFFIGSVAVDKDLTINGEIVQVHSSGGFAHFVSLVEGENDFEIVSGDEILNYVVTRPKKVVDKNYKPPRLLEYQSRKEFLTSVDNSPLRATPVNSGINRVAHFPKDVPIVVDGEKSSFYRVVLGENKKAWISKTNVKAFSDKLSAPASVLGYDFVDDEKYYIFKFHLNKKTPFEINEGNIFYLKFYNVADCKDNTYVFTFPYAVTSGTQKIVGYSGEYEGNDFILKIRKYPEINVKRPLEDITIAVDAGHGGKEFGAIGCCGDKEKDITLAIAKYLKNELVSRGAKVVMTRDDDSYVGLSERVEKANKLDSMFLISIHGNALPDYLNPLEHKGTNVLLTMNEQLGTQNDKIRQGSLALVRNTNALSILIEVAYLINPEDNAMLIDSDFQKKCAEAVADGIEKYLLNE